MQTNPTPHHAARPGERGAALVTTLMLATLLLVGGGALILKTSGAVGVAYDSTSEMQAYYAAEAGLQAALNVVRGNHQNVAGTKATFRNIVGAANSGDFSQWLTYNGNGVVPVGDFGFTVTAVDPDDLPAGTEPEDMVITAVGFGPRGARKRLELKITRSVFDFTAQATVLMRSSSSGGAMPANNFAIGNSNSKTYSGNDAAGGMPALPVFATTDAADTTTVIDIINNSKPQTVTNSAQGKAATLGNSSLPNWLQNPDDARALLAELRAMAQSEGRYFTGDDPPDDIGTPSDPLFTFVDGDFSMGGSDAGGGLLVVTGTLTNNGAADYSGLILALGGGNVQRSGGGNGNILGGIVIAAFDEDDMGAPFTAPTFQTDGGGTNTLQYDSVAISNALNSLGIRVLGVKEN